MTIGARRGVLPDASYNRDGGAMATPFPAWWNRRRRCQRAAFGVLTVRSGEHAVLLPRSQTW